MFNQSNNTAAADRRAFWIDIVIRLALGSFFVVAASVYCAHALKQAQQVDPSQSQAYQAIDALSVLSIAFYSLFVAYLYVVRLRPVNKFAGLQPAVIAVGGGFIMFTVLLFDPRMGLSAEMKMVATMLILTGNVASLWIMHYLGKSFSILPEGRKLVTGGPYRYIRNPLYLAEALATLGTLIIFFAPVVLALVIVQYLLQLSRIHYEEQVLRETFPEEFAAYCRQTPARLIPRIY